MTSWLERSVLTAPGPSGAGVQVLDVELRGDPLRRQAVEDRRQLVVAGAARQRVPARRCVASHPVQVALAAADGRRAEEPVEQHVLLGDVPVVRDVAAVVVAHRGRAVEPEPAVGRDEPVHPAAVVLTLLDADALAQVLGGRGPDAERLDAPAGRGPRQLQPLAHAGRDAVGAGVGPEVVVERVVVLHQHHHVLDRRRGRRVRAAWRPRRGGARSTTATRAKASGAAVASWEHLEDSDDRLRRRSAVRPLSTVTVWVWMATPWYLAT